jgi:hypothetical protein
MNIRKGDLVKFPGYQTVLADSGLESCRVCDCVGVVLSASRDYDEYSILLDDQIVFAKHRNIEKINTLDHI